MCDSPIQGCWLPIHSENQNSHMIPQENKSKCEDFDQAGPFSLDDIMLSFWSSKSCEFKCITCYKKSNCLNC